MPRTPTPPKKERTGPQKRAAAANLAKANASREIKSRQKKLVAIDTGLKDLSGKIDDKVDKQIAARFKKVDRKQLKNDVMQIFYDLGGKKFFKKWAKENPGKYMNILSALLKSETESERDKGGGVTVNIYGLDDDDRTIDVTPNT